MAGFDLDALFQQAQQLQEQMREAQDRLAQLYESVSTRDLIEIAILAVAIYAILRFLGKTRGAGMVRGLGMVVVQEARETGCAHGGEQRSGSDADRRLRAGATGA